MSKVVLINEKPIMVENKVVASPDQNLQDKSIEITENGNYAISSDSDYTGLDEVLVNVNVPSQSPNLQSKTITLGSASPNNVIPDTGHDGLSEVNINIDTTAIKASYIAAGTTILGIAGSYSGSVSAPNGNIELTQKNNNIVAGYATASVRDGSMTLNQPTINSSGLITVSASVGTSGWIENAPSNVTKQLTTQAGKTVTPTESEQTVVQGGLYTTGAIKVAAIPSDYIGSQVQIQGFWYGDEDPPPDFMGDDGDIYFVEE